LKVGYVSSEILFKKGVRDLGLAVRLWVMGSGQSELDTEFPYEGPLEVRDELRTTVGDDTRREAMVFENLVYEDGGNGFY